MALNATVLANLMAAKREAGMPPDVQAKLTDSGRAELQASAKADAEAIIEHFTTAGVITVTSTIIMNSIATAGGPAAQTGPTAPLPVSGTGTIA